MKVTPNTILAINFILVGVHVYSYFSARPIIDLIGVLSIMLAIGIVFVSLILSTDKKSTYLDEEFSAEHNPKTAAKAPDKAVLYLGFAGLGAARIISSVLQKIDPTGRVEYNFGYFIAHLLLIPCFIFFWLLMLSSLLP